MRISDRMRLRPEDKRPDAGTVLFRYFREKQNKNTGRVGGARPDV